MTDTAFEHDEYPFARSRGKLVENCVRQTAARAFRPVIFR